MAISIHRLASLLLTATLMLAPFAECYAALSPDRREARNNRRTGGNGHNQHSGSNGRRPGANSHNGSGSNNHNRSGADRPGNNSHPGNHRPGNGSNHNQHNGSHWQPSRPSHHTPAPSHRPPYIGLPVRPHLPAPRPFRRPVPPPAWRPTGHYPVLSTILGVTFGTGISLSINALVNNGYNVSGYGNDMVYLTNVPQLNFVWPDATLYYSNGGLCSSQFVYATPYSDMGRFNAAYSRLVNLYGAPVNYNTASGNITASWFGNNGQFVSLSFAPAYTAAGTMSYYTTLSFGR